MYTLKEVNGIDCGNGTVMNCKWRGPKLKDIRDHAGINVQDIKATHVAFACYKTQDHDSDWYRGSIDMERALRDSADVLVAAEVFLLCQESSRRCLWLLDERQAAG